MADMLIGTLQEMGQQNGLFIFPGQGSVVRDMFSHGALKVSVGTLTVVIDHLSI